MIVSFIIDEDGDVMGHTAVIGTRDDAWNKFCDQFQIPKSDAARTPFIDMSIAARYKAKSFEFPVSALGDMMRREFTRDFISIEQAFMGLLNLARQKASSSQEDQKTIRRAENAFEKLIGKKPQ